MSNNATLLGALREYDDSMAAQAQARKQVRRAEEALKRAVGARPEEYMDGNELVAALGRRLVENLDAAASSQEQGS